MDSNEPRPSSFVNSNNPLYLDPSNPCVAQDGTTDFLQSWFSFYQSPEPHDLAAFFSALDEEAAHTFPFAGIVEMTFSQLFYNAIWTLEMVEKIKAWLGEPIIHTIQTTPFRKFKASLAWLSSGCQEEALLDCLCVELLFSLFYILDDALDEKTTRYGRQTSFGKFGYKRSLLCWSAGQQPGRLGGHFLQGDKGRIDLWRATLDQIYSSEQAHVAEDSPQSFEQYCERSVKRTHFLGVWWEQAAQKVHDAELGRLTREAYPLYALAGQLRNDLRNADQSWETISGGIPFSDFTDGRATAVTICVRDMASPKQRGWIQEYVWNQKTALSPDLLERLATICYDSGALFRVREHLDATIARIEGSIEASQLSPEVKSLWLGWVYRQFREGITSYQAADGASALKFVNAARLLSRKVMPTYSLR